MEKIFEGKKALVVGGSKGTGSHICRMLQECGAKVTCVSRNAPVQKDVEFISVDFQKDLNLESSTPEMESLRKSLSDCDLLFICYGPFVQKPIEETTPVDWNMMALQNYALPGMLISCALPHMKENHWGRIVVFGGTRTESVKNFKTNVAYAGAKTGVSVIVKSVAAEYAQCGITCNCILPGFTHSAPDNTLCVEEEILAQHAVFAATHGELNGLLMNVDRGWVPQK